MTNVGRKIAREKVRR